VTIDLYVPNMKYMKNLTHNIAHGRTPS